MPQSPTANMGLIKPTENGDADVWDTLLDAIFDLIDVHDHTTGKGVKIPSAAFNINADVPWGSVGANYAITLLKAIEFVPVAAASITSYVDGLFVNSSDSNNLYFRNHAGTNVKITDGSTLNVSIVGGIGGDYSSIGALLDYDDATDSYRFRQQTSASVRQFAKLRSADVLLFEYFAAGASPVPTNAVTLKSPAALAGSYSLTMPAVLPGATSLVRVSSTGVLAGSGTIDENLTLASARTITLQGSTGYIKRGNEDHTVHLLPAAVNTSAGSITVTGGTPGGQLQNSTTSYFQIPLQSDRVRVQTIKIKNFGTGTGNITFDVMSADDTLKIFGTQLAAPVTVAAGAAGYTTLTIQTPTAPWGGQSGRGCWLKIVTAAGNTFDFTTAIVTDDIP